MTRGEFLTVQDQQNRDRFAQEAELDVARENRVAVERHMRARGTWGWLPHHEDEHPIDPELVRYGYRDDR